MALMGGTTLTAWEVDIGGVGWHELDGGCLVCKAATGNKGSKQSGGRGWSTQ